jgi:hypothetical protein
MKIQTLTPTLFLCTFDHNNYNQYKNMLNNPNFDGMVTLTDWMTKE